MAAINVTPAPARKTSNVIVFDQRVEQKITKDASTKIKDLAKIMNESGFDIVKCVPSSYDSDARKLYQTNEENKRDFIVVELALDEEKDTRIQIKKFEGFLAARKYNVVAKKEYKDGDYPTFKVIVKLA